MQTLRDGQRTVAADRHDGVDAEAFHGLLHGILSAELPGVRSAGADDRAAHLADASYALTGQRDRIADGRAAPAPLNPVKE